MIGRLRVVIADDERPARSFLAALLRSFDDVVVVAEAESGADAVAAIERERPDLALLDLQMPEVDGIGVVRMLKKNAMPLIAFVTEFGRMPTFQKGASGRDHNPYGFTCWLAGAGVKRAFHHGATDEFGHKAVEQVTTIYDLHATILHLLGLNHERLSFYHNGIERRLTDVHGHVVSDVLT